MTKMRMGWTLVVAVLVGAPTSVHALDLGSLAKKAAGGATSAARDKAAKEVNAKLLAG